jgi:hypothetical protein
MTSQQRHGHADQTLPAAYRLTGGPRKRLQTADTCAPDADQRQSLSVTRCLVPTRCQIVGSALAVDYRFAFSEEHGTASYGLWLSVISGPGKGRYPCLSAMRVSDPRRTGLLGPVPFAAHPPAGQVGQDR